MKCPSCQNDNPDGTRFCGRCGRELAARGDTAPSGTATFQTPTRGLDRGTVFARRFEIIEEIGRGGMGTVYKAYDSKIREVVALKLLKPEIASEAEIVERFRNEIKLARQVSHRHVCRTYDLGEEWLSIYISMEYVPGEDLKSFIRRSGHVNEAKAVGLARQIAEGLAEAHRLGVVHRDLKPQNIMIDRDGNAKIMDFGIARSLQTRGATGTGVIIGTPEYMAPEQADGRGVDHRSDIYSLGAVLFEMVTGRVPFEGRTPLGVVLKHRSEPPADPQTLNAQLSAGLSRIILRCLEKAPERRYQSAADVLADLTAVERGLPVAAPAEPTAKAKTASAAKREYTVKFTLRKAVLPAVVVVVLAAVGLKTLIDRGRAEKEGPAHGVVLRQGPTPAEGVGKVVVVPPPPPAPGQDNKAGSAILGYLAPFVKDPSKVMSAKDAAEFEKALAVVREKFPKESAALSRWLDGIQVRLTEAKKHQEAGDVEASRKSFDRGESDLRKFMAQVSERDRAEKAFQDLQETKRRTAAASASGRPNLLAWIALEKEKDASDAFAADDFSGARILCGILSRVHLLSLRAAEAEPGLAALRELAASIRSEAEAARAPAKQAWLFERAKAEEDGARAASAEGAVPRAAEQYILAAFLYEKAKEVALESAEAGRE